MRFQFSITKALRQSWQSFMRHPLFFGTLAFVMVIFNIFTGGHHKTWLMIVVFIATMLWNYVWISASLAAVDGKDDILNLRSLSVHMPDLRQFLSMTVISILTMLIVAAGIVLLILPGIYFAARLAFSTISFVDHQQSIKRSLEHSWHLVKGRIFWTVLLVLLVELALIVAGSIVLMIGLLITYPLAMMLIARLYRELDTQHRTLHSQ